jgi:hypothetical protein
MGFRSHYLTRNVWITASENIRRTFQVRRMFHLTYLHPRLLGFPLHHKIYNNNDNDDDQQAAAQ